jgi:hypothetical protein
MRPPSCPRSGDKETSKLKQNMEDQLDRLMTQLRDLEENRYGSSRGPWPALTPHPNLLAWGDGQG